MMTALLCFVTFIASAVIDFAQARCIVAINAGARHRAAAWSIAGWAGGTVGFLIAVKVTTVVLPFEAIGMYFGTVLAVKGGRQPPRTLAQHLSQPIDVSAVMAKLATTTSRSPHHTWS